MGTRLHITFIMTICILIFVCAAHAEEAAPEGTLHSASLYQYHKASFADKIATATDWVAGSVSVRSAQDLKEKTFGLVVYLDKLCEEEGKRYAKETKAFNQAIIGMAECEYPLV